MAQVTLRKVIKKYDEVLAVRGIDLDVHHGEVVALLGYYSAVAIGMKVSNASKMRLSASSVTS